MPFQEIGFYLALVTMFSGLGLAIDKLILPHQEVKIIDALESFWLKVEVSVVI